MATLSEITYTPQALAPVVTLQSESYPCPQETSISHVNIVPRLTQSLRDKEILLETDTYLLEDCQQLYDKIIFRLVNPFLLPRSEQFHG